MSQGQDYKFNAELIKETILTKLIPEGFEQRRMDRGRFTYETKWKHGFLKKVLLDDTDISNKIPLVQAQNKIELILRSSKKFRINYTGTITFVCTIENSKIDSIYVNMGSYMITKFSEYKRVR